MGFASCRAKRVKAAECACDVKNPKGALLSRRCKCVYKRIIPWCRLHGVAMRWLNTFIVAFVLVGCVQPHPTEATASDPIIRKLTADPPVIQIGASSTVTVEAEDPFGGPLSYQWTASAGDIIGQGESVRYTASFCCTGSNRVKVTVKNNRGGSTSQSIDVYVNP